jgi:hypothetical protein
MHEFALLQFPQFLSPENIELMKQGKGRSIKIIEYDKNKDVFDCTKNLLIAGFGDKTFILLFLFTIAWAKR